MKECMFKCEYLDETGECEPIQGECIGDMCENWKDCASCAQQGGCKEQEYKRDVIRHGYDRSWDRSI